VENNNWTGISDRICIWLYDLVWLCVPMAKLASITSNFVKYTFYKINETNRTIRIAIQMHIILFSVLNTKRMYPFIHWWNCQTFQQKIFTD